jgi:hypothetical protein
MGNFPKKNYVSYFKSVKEQKIRMGATRRNLQAPKILKKLSEHQIDQSEQKFSEKKYGGYPTEFAGTTQNPKKIIRTPNLPIRTKIFPKKVCLVP